MNNDQLNFEAWASHSMNLAKNCDGEYCNMAVHSCWSAWRAALSGRDYVAMLYRDRTVDFVNASVQTIPAQKESK